MIAAVDFKKHISKTLSGHLRELGFKGSGFNYLMDTDDFVFTIGIQASQYGGQCCAEFGIQPKSVDTNGFEKLDFKKLKYYSCELRTRIAPTGKGDKWWKYSESENENINIAIEISNLIKEQYVVVINAFKNNPNILETIDTYDLENMYQRIPRKLNGMRISTSNVRFAWFLVKAFEKNNLEKAKEFARYGLSKLEPSDKFFAKNDFEQILTENNGS